MLRMLAGATAGIIAMSSTYHLDMVRGRLTVQEGINKQQYDGILHAYHDIIQKVLVAFTNSILNAYLSFHAGHHLNHAVCFERLWTAVPPMKKPCLAT
jgi:solute carrier family 25 (mitochondrial phosphate transporter), member 23/24/25/41